MINSFNQMQGYVCRYVVREGGPIAENVREKSAAILGFSRGLGGILRG